MISLLASLLLLFSLLPSLLGAQTPTERILALENEVAGYNLVGDIGSGSLPKGGEGFFPVRLQAGSSYVVVGFCGEGCDDLDLMLLDPLGNLLASDIAATSEPVLPVRAGLTGVHQVWAIVGECAGDPCSFAVGVYGVESVEEQAAGRDLRERLAAFQFEFEAQGFTELGTVEAGSLRSGQETRVPLALREGVEYRIAGGCDNDCKNLDLVLYDPFGTELRSDRMDDAIPVLDLTASVTGEHRVAVQMVVCAVDRCDFEVLWFGREAGVVAEAGAPAITVVSDVVHRGRLAAGDRTLWEGEYYHEYPLEVRAGQTITLDLRSEEFDTFLILKAPGGSIEQNDDHEGDPNHSRIELEALETGTYTAVVTSFAAGERGTYLLRAVVTER